MSGLYESIPQNKKEAYLENAEAAVREATDPVFNKLGELVVQQAETISDGQPTLLGPEDQATNLTIADAQAPQLVEETERFLDTVANGGNADEFYPNDTAPFEAGGRMNDKAYYALAGRFDKLDASTQRLLTGAGFVDEKGQPRAPADLKEIAAIADILRQSPVASEQIGARGLEYDFSTKTLEEDSSTQETSNKPLEKPGYSISGSQNFNHLSQAEMSKLEELDRKIT